MPGRNLFRRLDAGTGTLFGLKSNTAKEKGYRMKYLDDALTSYSRADNYPFHMPGHKRRELCFPNPYCIDITEIDGFDNLHHAEGILREAQERAADLYGSKRCFYLINGSTCGILAAICAATKKRDKVLIARNSHKSIYHAAELNELSVRYLYPVITETDLQGQITPEQVREAIKKEPDIKAIVITSPTYEGIISDIKGITEAAHDHGIPVIVDEAHGAHLGFGGGFPENAVQQGADAVVMSLHKTLPSFTQTALLHLNSNRIPEEEIARYLGIFETSSPSYLLMSGMDACVRMLWEHGAVLFREYRKRLDSFYRDTADLKKLHVLSISDFTEKEVFRWDDSKLVIFTGAAGMTGEELHRILLDTYHIQMEMVSAFYVLGMTSIMDTEEGFARLSAALHEIDSGVRTADRNIFGSFTRSMYVKNGSKMHIYQASEYACKEVGFEEAVGQVSAGYVYFYPPGIPVIVPGEIITRELIEYIREYREKHLCIEGISNLPEERIKIVYF